MPGRTHFCLAPLLRCDATASAPTAQQKPGHTGESSSLARAVARNAVTCAPSRRPSRPSTQMHSWLWSCMTFCTAPAPTSWATFRCRNGCRATRCHLCYNTPHSTWPSAHARALLQRGDILQAIDGVDVFKRPAQEVSGLLLGARDTSVRVSLFRELVRRPRFAPNRAHARSVALPHFSLPPDHALTQLLSARLARCALRQTPEKAQSLQGQDLTYPQHFVSSRRVFELYSVVAKRSVPIDTGVGTHFPANASPAAQHASQRFSSPRPHSLAPVQPLASPGRMRGIDAQSDISFR